MATITCPDGSIVEYFETVRNPASPRIRFENDRTSATRTFDVAWGDYYRFAWAMLGSSDIGASGAFTNPATGSSVRDLPCIKRYVPHGFPFVNSDSLSWLWASSVDVEGRGVPESGVMYELGGASAVSVYEQARCTVNYESRTYDIINDARMLNVSGQTMDESRLLRYVTTVYRPEGKFLTMDGSSFYYAGLSNSSGAAVPLFRGTSKTLIKINVSTTWHQVPKKAIPSVFFNEDAVNRGIDKCLGRVNDATFNGYKQGTLLLMGVELKPIISALGDRIYDITYNFQYFNPSTTEYFGNVPGHNHIFRPFGTANTQGWYEAVSSSSLAISGTPTNFVAKTESVNIYDHANFKMLFRPATYNGPA